MERSKGQVIAWVAVAALVAVAGFRFSAGGEAEPPAAPIALEEGVGEDGERPGGGAGAQVYVHVAGEVREPGLYRVRGGTRVGDAIDRAGGTLPRAELAGVNLAAELQDGQQVVVPRRGAAPVGTGGSVPPGADPAAETGAPAAPISLAQATPEQLDAEVEGIGPVLAASIIEFRDERGSLESIDELREVDGIGEERLATLREALVP
ncbi:MAG TPA: SLBB domain-containing protein [Thermoleophilaceae bacterium]|nr:SLBB domain-containing protein [Thermoleophilaceae bacterium]